MSNLFVFTASDVIAWQHLQKSIANPIQTKLVFTYVDKRVKNILESIKSREGGLYAWGVIPGDRNKPNWEKMQEGDYVLAYSKGEYHYLSSVAFKFHNKIVAEKIWGKDPEGKTWEYMYFLTSPIKFSKPVPISDLDYFTNNYLNKGYRGFVNISDEKVKKIEKEFGSLELFFKEKFKALSNVQSIDKILIDLESEYDGTGKFDPTNLDDERKRNLSLIVQRRGQSTFRKSLISAYEGKCAATECDVLDALEAAHIIPYKGTHTNDLRNGILLRADIHTLFDCGKIAINSSDMTLVLSENLKFSAYQDLHGKKLLLPADSSNHPDKIAIDAHRYTAGI